MASKPPWSLSTWKPITRSPIKLPNSSIIFSFRTFHREQTHFTTFSLDPPSSSPRVCCASHTNNAGNRLKKSVEKNGDEVSSGDPRKSSTRLSLKSLFGSQLSWRRIVFASRKVRSIILLNVITVVYASDIPVLKEVEAIMDPAAFTVVRFAVSAIPFIPFVLRARGDAQTRNAGIELGFWVSLGYLMQALGLVTSDAGRASFISMFTVIVVPLLDGMLGAIVPAHTWFGALMSVLGVAMLESSGSPPNVGDLLNFLSAIFFGIHMLRTEHISRSTDKENFLPLLGYEVCVVAGFSTLWYVLAAWFGDVQGSNPSSWTWTMFWDWMAVFPWIPALYTGVLSTGLCLWVEIAAMRDVSATETAIIYGMEPVWGAGFAWFLLGERWGVTGWIGAALVLGGSLMVQILGSSSSSSPSEGEERKESGRVFVSDEKGKKAQHAPNLSPEKVHKVEIHQGEWGDHGSIKVWTYVAEGQVETYKEKVSIDEENKTVHMTALEGHCLELYKSYNIIYEFIHKGETNAVKITIEYEKKNEHIPPPQKYMDFLISLIKDLDANLVN